MLVNLFLCLHDIENENKWRYLYRFMDGGVDQIWLKHCLSEVSFLRCSCSINPELSFWNTVFRVILTPCNFRPSTVANSFAPAVLISPRHSMFKKKIIWNAEICPALTSPSDNKGERSENRGRIFSCIQY